MLRLLLCAAACCRWPTASPYNFAASLFVTALSGPMLGEHVGIRRWIAVGFRLHKACCWSVQPSPSGISLGAGPGAAPGSLLGAHDRHLAQISGTESSHTIRLLLPGGRRGAGRHHAQLVDPTLLPRLDLVHRRRPLRQLRPVLLQSGLPLRRGLHGRPAGLSQHRLGDADGLRRVRRHSELAVLGGAACIIASSIYIARREAMLARARRKPAG